MERRERSRPDILLIIIDQLRLDYLPYLEKTGALLPYHAICTTGSIPASTEAMHTNISTGLWPKNHGFISKNPKGHERKGKGLDELLEKFQQGTITPIGHLAKAEGYDVINIGGKKETVLTMSLKKYASAQVFLEEGTLQAVGSGAELVEPLSYAITSRGYEHKQLGDLSLALLDLSRDLISIRHSEKPRFITLALPDLDILGHRHGPSSKQVIDHLQTVDTVLFNTLLAVGPSSAIFLLGDHGCRHTSKYVIETTLPGMSKIYHEQEGGYAFRGNISFETSVVKHIEYDGGILRMWFENANYTLPAETISLLSQYGTPIDDKVSYDQVKSLAISRSLHENLGELTIVAHPDSTFCKNGWIPADYRKIVESGDKLQPGNLPIGEHGTYYTQDTDVPLLSNTLLEKGVYENVEISALITRQFRQ